MKTRILSVLALLLAVTSVSAAKKDKNEAAAPIYAIKSGIIITTTDMAAMRERFENIDTAAMRERFANRQGGEGMPEGMPAFNWDENAENVTMVYFDDYGAKQATVSKMGGRTTRTITDADGATITINEEQKTATKMPAMNFRGMGSGMGGFGGGMGF